MTTIDEYRRSAGIRRIDVVKIDIEGSELDAFRGMEETFTICPPALIVCELALLIEPLTDGLSAPAGKVPRAGYALRIIEFLRSKGYAAHYTDQPDGRIGDVVDTEAIIRFEQNLINVAFVHDSLRTTRPDLFKG